MSSDYKASALDEPSFHDADKEFFYWSTEILVMHSLSFVCFSPAWLLQYVFSITAQQHVKILFKEIPSHMQW